MSHLFLLLSTLAVFFCTALHSGAQQDTGSTNGRTGRVEKSTPKTGDLPLEDVLPRRVQVIRTEVSGGEDTEGMRSMRLSQLALADYPKFFAVSSDTSGHHTVTIRAYMAHNVVIRLLTVDGQPLGTIWTGTLTKGIDNYTLDTSGITSGAYFLSLESRDGSRFHTIKLVVQ